MSPKFCPFIKESCKEMKCALWEYNNCLIYIYLGCMVESDREECFDESKNYVHKSFVGSFWDRLKNLRDFVDLEDHK